MELNEVKLIKLGDLKLYIRYSNRALLDHLNRTTKDPDNYENIFHYFYDLAKRGAKDRDEDFKYTFEQFFDLIDPYPDALSKFNEAVEELFGEDKKKLKGEK